MSITSFHFFAAFAVSLLIYYVVPCKFRWILLLLYSVYFLARSTGWVTIPYFIACVVTATITTSLVQGFRESGRENAAKKIVACGICVNLCILGILKYSDFFISNYNRVFQMITGREGAVKYLGLASPLGISFFALISIGYMADVYWGVAQASSNPFRVAVFVGYYPQLTSGPVTRWSETWNQLFRGNRFDYDRICFGIQRMMWGIFKKIVISARAQIIVDAVFSNTDDYNGLYIWLAMALFNVQLYTDFSGCMDIVTGASECYGIELPENFRTPFFSETVQEFWQRWHITLGTWMKNYILYPVLKSRPVQDMGDRLKRIFGKKHSKKITAYLGMLCVWLLIGLWHGGEWRYILGMGLWFWAIIVFENVTEPWVRNITEKLSIDRNNFGWHFFQSLKVFLAVGTGNVFFRSDGMSSSVNVLKSAVSEFNPWIFFDGSIAKMGISYREQNVLIFSIFLLVLASVIQERNGGVRKWIKDQFVLFRWMIWLFLFAFILIEGKYGPGYSASEFIYRGF